jgi:menaquinone-specific isochorismate synthase
MTLDEISQSLADTGQPIDVLQAASGQVPCVFYRTPETTLVGLGVAASCEARPGETLPEIERRFRSRLRDSFGDDNLPDDLVIFFHVAFDPERRTDPRWEAFDRIRMLVPRATFGWRDGELTTVRLGPGDVDDLLEEAVGGPGQSPRRSGSSLQVERPYLDAYRASIERARRTDHLDRVAIARMAEATANRPIDSGAVLAALGYRHPNARLFHISPGPDSPTFVGASLDRLIRLDGTRAETTALAGTAHYRDRSAEEAAEALRRSSADLREHTHVVRNTVETLEGLGGEVNWDDHPRTVTLPDIVHLQTTMIAQMPDQRRIVDLVDALHPAPSVCGTPTEPAREMIHELEPFDRGLYTGAVGWTDLAGDGDVTVALRGGLIGAYRAQLYASAGVTTDSDPETVAAETETQIAPMVFALRQGLT